ncbi:hypothetical protein C1H46_043610 [Malus baccata]|uniref:Uncharacterized protein n=1 Tax=Malus baccata TaxID=106549 RepID=A0A540K9E2_MALBA|nr:hypothetical protein C1H46_043610 [Malus baccata]
MAGVPRLRFGGKEGEKIKKIAFLLVHMEGLSVMVSLQLMGCKALPLLQGEGNLIVFKEEEEEEGLRRE